MTWLNPLEKKLTGVLPLSKINLEGLKALSPKPLLFRKDDSVVRTGARHSHTYLITSGWAISYRFLPNGGRQISNVLLPGDFACLTSVVSPVADYTVSAVTPLAVMAFNPTCLVDILQVPNELRDMMLWTLDQEISILTERLVSVGRRTAYERVAHTLLELWIRLKQAGECNESAFELPLRLEGFSDLVSLTDVHLSRTIRSLREDGLFKIDFLQRRVQVLNRRAAMAAACFDPAYLKFGLIDLP